MAARRRNGFQRPFTNDQILSWVAEPVAATVFYLIVGTFVEGAAQVALLAVFSALLVAHLATWLYCSWFDPAEDKGWFWPCMREAQGESRYCAVCRKTVPGLDHHCTWLNTCIGRRQYPAFFALVTIGTAMYWLEVVVFIVLLTSGLTPEVEAEAVRVLGSLTTYKVLVSLATVIVLALALGLSILFVFHTFLQFQHKGTYAWMIDRANVRVERNRAARAATANAAAAAAEGSSANGVKKTDKSSSMCSQSAGDDAGNGDVATV